MQRIVFLGLMAMAVIAAFFTAFILAPMGAVEITIPAKAVGTATGVLVFVFALAALVVLIDLLHDLIFYKRCRKFLAELMYEAWNEWFKYVASCYVTAGLVGWFFFGELIGTLAAFGVGVLGIACTYLYYREGLIATVGPDYFYPPKIVVAE